MPSGHASAPPPPVAGATLFRQHGDQRTRRPTPLANSHMPLPALARGAEDDDSQSVRTNGFGRPFHPLQVLSWVVSALDVAVYSFVGLPLLEPDAVMFFVALCYAASVIVLVIAAAKATGCDPIDPRVPRAQELEGEDSDDLPFCPICDVVVEVRSKHCRTCNKCIDVFDHHCMWLNNCIGRANYRAFFVTVCSVAVMTGILLATCVYVLCTYFADEDKFVQRAQSIVLFRSSPRELLLGLTIVLVIVNLPLFLLDLQLVLLHLFLMSQNLTTFEYIVNKQERSEAREDGKDLNTGKLGKSSVARARILSRNIRTLPRCMDWIVFCRCGQRKKRRQHGISKISVEESAPTVLPEPEDVPGSQAHSHSHSGGGGFPQLDTPQFEEEDSCVDRAKDRDLSVGDSPQLGEVAIGTPNPGKPTGVLPQQRQANAEKDGSGCSAYSGIAVMWRFILGLGRTSLAT